MLKKKQRLTKRQFDAHFKVGKRYHSPLLQLIYVPHESFHGAAVVGKKVSKKAVVRNKHRRRMYAALYDLYKKDALTGVYILIAKPDVLHTPYSELKHVISDTIGRIGKKR